MSIGDNHHGQHPARLKLAPGPAAAKTGDTRTVTTLTIGIADTDELKARARRIMQGEEQPSPGEPAVWFGSTESFARILSAANRDMLRLIAEREPESLDALVALTGRAKPNLSRTLKAMIAHGIVRMERSGRKLAPKVIPDRVVLALELIPTSDKQGDRP